MLIRSPINVFLCWDYIGPALVSHDCLWFTGKRLRDCKQMCTWWHYCVHCAGEKNALCFENRVHYISIKLHKAKMWRNRSIYVSVKDKAITEKKFNVETNISRQESLGHTPLSQEEPHVIGPALLVPHVWIYITRCITFPDYCAGAIAAYVTEQNTIFTSLWSVSYFRGWLGPIGKAHASFSSLN